MNASWYVSQIQSVLYLTHWHALCLLYLLLIHLLLSALFVHHQLFYCFLDPLLFCLSLSVIHINIHCISQNLYITSFYSLLWYIVLSFVPIYILSLCHGQCMCICLMYVVFDPSGCYTPGFISFPPDITPGHIEPLCHPVILHSSCSGQHNLLTFVWIYIWPMCQ